MMMLSDPVDFSMAWVAVQYQPGQPELGRKGTIEFRAAHKTWDAYFRIDVPLEFVSLAIHVGNYRTHYQAALAASIAWMQHLEHEQYMREDRMLSPAATAER